MGPVRIRWYGLMFLLGFSVGYFVIKRMCAIEKKSFERLENLLIYLVAGTAIGARLGHCLFYEPAYYLSRPLEIFKIWEGGLASHGGTIGVILAIWLYSRRYPEFSFMWILDRISVPVAFVASLIRVGNLMNSEILGRPTDLLWAFVFKRVDAVPRHPAQLYESLSYMTLFWITMRLYKRNPKSPPGFLFGVTLTWIFAWRIVWEFFKENQEPFEAGMALNMGQILSIPFIAVGIFAIVRSKKIRALAQRGFTLIEMLMVVVIVAVLSAVAIPQFVDFRKEAKTAAMQSALGAMRSSIAAQYGQVLIRCGAVSGTYPTAAQLNANDITTGGAPCTVAMVPQASDRKFVPAEIPENPWSGSSVSVANRRVVTQCVGGGCTRNGVVSCDGATAYGAAVGGWCYDSANGSIWANSANDGVAAPNGEYSF